MNTNVLLKICISCILEFYSKFSSAGEKLRYANTVHCELTWLALAALRAKYSNPINSISMEICQEHTHQPISVPTRPSWKHGEKLGKRKEWMRENERTGEWIKEKEYREREREKESEYKHQRKLLVCHWTVSLRTQHSKYGGRLTAIFDYIHLH